MGKVCRRGKSGQHTDKRRGRGGAGLQKQCCQDAYLAEVAGVVLVEHDAMVMLATGVTATAGMLPVLSDSSVAGADMTSLLAVLAETCMAARCCQEAAEAGTRAERACRLCQVRSLRVTAAKVPSRQRPATKMSLHSSSAEHLTACMGRCRMKAGEATHGSSWRPTAHRTPRESKQNVGARLGRLAFLPCVKN